MFYRTSPVAAPESFSFPACNFIIKETTEKMLFCEFCNIFKGIFSFDRTPQDGYYTHVKRTQISHMFRVRSFNHRVYIYTKTWLWHDMKNSQLKKFLPLYTVLLIYSKVKVSHRFSMVEQIQSRIAKIGSKWSIHLIKKTFPVFHIYTVVKNHKKSHSYLTVSQ